MARSKAWKILTQMEMLGLIRWYYPPEEMTEDAMLSSGFFRGTGIYRPTLFESWRWYKTHERLKR